MASSTSSGYRSQSSSIAVNPHYACYWLDSCCGQHELTTCSKRREELHGKLGIYYSPNGIYKRFARDALSSVNLSHNPTGCTRVHLLIYRIRPNGRKEVLFGLSYRKNTPDEATRHPLLSFPYSEPRKRDEYGKPIARRAFQSISDNKDIGTQGLKSRFLFQHANVIYPWYVTENEADSLTENFTANEEIISLHWFPLTLVLERLPQWNNYLISEATHNELAQHGHIKPTEVRLGEYEVRPLTAMCLMCIREHVSEGFETFLK
ncbi:unnamed protein product [Adineta ricciae]|uniref:Uncharacterized protein n=1 Tax=Adineta ricciae TaxID=249248 RepID=A0A815V113_ADIRI|nr:unnamed protein product [Adineta ricciae]CAF1651784.1 unnamed protein product [Adineta ricciae]